MLIDKSLSWHHSTYRIQFNHLFTFKEMAKNVDYLTNLGIDTVYASPILSSTPGSMHGYDVVDPAAIDLELGGEKEFARLFNKLQKSEIGWLQDIVPNHMAFNSYNTWLWDVLEKGKDSEYARIFDIDWNHPEFTGKLMVPFLGKSLEEVIGFGELNVGFIDGTFVFHYYDEIYPINLPGFQTILRKKQNQLPDFYIDFLKLTGGKVSVDPSILKQRWEEIKTDLSKNYKMANEVGRLVRDILSGINKDPSFIRSIHDVQYYRLCYWKLTEKMINYRRFFTVNGLICLRMEDRSVFERYHTYLKNLIDKYRINGFRVDHVDGLFNPDQYLSQLRMLTGRKTYIIIEKILDMNEELPERWNIQGTTGYDFLSYVNNLMTNVEEYPELSAFYRDITGNKTEIDDIIYEKKKFILLARMSGELENLARGFWKDGLVPSDQLRGTDPEHMKKAIAEFLIVFPIYRLYSTTIPLDKTNSRIMNHLFKRAIFRNPSLKKELRILLNLFINEHGPDDTIKKKALYFFNRCMQYTGPVMAKGVEDTTMYYFNQFVAHNEVGDHPGSGGITAEKFHELMRNRQEKWPLAMNSTSTHDTKRGEDVRARLNVISDLVPEWTSLVRKWLKINKGLKQTVNGRMVPTLNEEYLVYQTLAGIWPMNNRIDSDFKDRLDNYFIKALREAKVYTSWNAPDEKHENAVIDFIHHIINTDSEFYASFSPFQTKIKKYGILNSVVQLVLKMTCPGIPDIYQGTELWDLSLVDPDNRRPVDYNVRRSRLNKLIKNGNKNSKAVWEDICNNPEEGNIKLWLTYLLLRERKLNPELFTLGEYIAFEVTGSYSNHLIAYCRKFRSDWILVVLPLHIASLSGGTGSGNMGVDWDSTAVQIPDEFSGICFDIIKREKTEFYGTLESSVFFESAPILILKSVLMPSL
jgi:malto-oligosyltrehalose synthase